METGHDAIDHWATEWGMRRDGRWHPDTIILITTVMENCAPYTWKTDPDKKKRYDALIRVGCRYLLDVPNDQQAQRLIDVIEQDIRLFSDIEFVETLRELQGLVRDALARGSTPYAPSVYE